MESEDLEDVSRVKNVWGMVVRMYVVKCVCGGGAVRLVCTVVTAVYTLLN